MSKERARRREERERQAAVAAAARAETARRRARRDALVAPVVVPARRLRDSLTRSKQTGTLAERKRMRVRIIVALLFFVQLVVWVVRPDWEARLAAFVIALFVFPVVAVFAL